MTYQHHITDEHQSDRACHLNGAVQRLLPMLLNQVTRNIHSYTEPSESECVQTTLDIACAQHMTIHLTDQVKEADLNQVRG